MTSSRNRLSFALAVALSAASLSCGSREDKTAPRVDAAEIAQDQDVLDQLRTAGSNLTKPHRIEFYLHLPTQADAEAAETTLRSLGYGVSVRPGDNGNNWLCLATRTMMPTIKELTDARVVFNGLATRFKGAYDGWETAIEH